MFRPLKNIPQKLTYWQIPTWGDSIDQFHHFLIVRLLPRFVTFFRSIIIWTFCRFRFRIWRLNTLLITVIVGGGYLTFFFMNWLALNVLKIHFRIVDTFRRIVVFKSEFLLYINSLYMYFIESYHSMYNGYNKYAQKFMTEKLLYH